MTDLDIEVFVTVHDQDIVLLQESNRKYDCLDRKYRYIFVGSGNTDKIHDVGNVVIARDLPENIEQHPSLVDFTAWYGLVKNSLIVSKYVILIQYDTVLTSDFLARSYSKIVTNPYSIIGYVPFDMKDENFLANNIGAEPLYEAVLDKYNINIYDYFGKHIQSLDVALWPSSNNILLSSNLLKKFVNWFCPLIPIIIKYSGAGHAFERSIKLFSLLEGIENLYLEEVLDHYQLNSHGTQDFQRGRKEKLRKLLVSNKLDSKKNILYRIFKYIINE